MNPMGMFGMPMMNKHPYMPPPVNYDRYEPSKYPANLKHEIKLNNESSEDSSGRGSKSKGDSESIKSEQNAPSTVSLADVNNMLMKSSSLTLFFKTYTWCVDLHHDLINAADYSIILIMLI